MIETSTSGDTVFDLVSEAATASLAAALARRANPGDVIALNGALGSGKTSFARAFIRSLGSGDEEVPSPTFTLVEIYEFARGGPAVWHFDLYRLKYPEEAYELGLEDALAGAIVLIEWPEHLGALLPRERLDLVLLPGSSPERRIARLAGSPRWTDRLRGVTP